MNIRDKITIVQGNIIQQDTDAIVNSANTNLVLGSGVAGAIKAADDGTVQRECDLIGKIRLGDAAITSGGATGIPFIIHAPVCTSVVQPPSTRSGPRYETASGEHVKKSLGVFRSRRSGPG